MVAARGINPCAQFCTRRSAATQSGSLVVVRQGSCRYFSAAPTAAGRSKWQEDPEANAIMSWMLKEGQERGVCVLPVYAVSEDAAATIVDLSALWASIVWLSELPNEAP
jgi:hypothetical protein